MRGELIVKKPGLLTSVQDTGRYGYRKWGVPVSGFMDRASAYLANALVNNPENSAVLEIALSGPELLFTKRTVIAITGADFSPTLNGQSIPMNCALAVDQGDILRFFSAKNHARAYLAVHGGIQSPVVMGSQSQFAPLTGSNRISSSDHLYYSETHLKIQPNARVKPNLDPLNINVLPVSAGPEFSLLSNLEQDRILSNPVTVGANNRMGYQLFPAKLSEHALQIITCPVVPGTIQLTPGGRLLALMQDAQVSGGYPRIFQLDAMGMNRLAQLRTGDEIKLIMSGT